MAAAGASFCILGVAAAIFELGGDALPQFATGAAGAAYVQFAQSEASAWRRPLSLGHQLAMWWFWPFAFPVFVVATRKRRSPAMTVAVLGPLAGIFALALGYFVFELTRWY